MPERALKQHGPTPIARIVTRTVSAGDPVVMLEEPIPRTRKAPARAGMTIDDIDLHEVNEAFAPIALARFQRRDRRGALTRQAGHAAGHAGHCPATSGGRAMSVGSPGTEDGHFLLTMSG